MSRIYKAFMQKIRAMGVWYRWAVVTPLSPEEDADRQTYSF